MTATLMGDGWQSREGSVWRDVGYENEYDKLRTVLVAEPVDALPEGADPNDYLMLERFDVVELIKQMDGLCEAYSKHGVEVLRPRGGSHNFIFQRDLSSVTKRGAILARPASRQRAPDELHMARALLSFGIPIHRTLQEGTFEGADLLRVNDEIVLIGVGNRTDTAGFLSCSQATAGEGTVTVPVALPKDVQHLLGCINFIDKDLVAVYEPAIPTLSLMLESEGIEIIPIAAGPEFYGGRCMNFVTVGPRAIVMPSACPNTRRLYESKGVDCTEVLITQLLKCAGGMACATGIVRRHA